MGGVAITQAAARCPERIALLVYVAAFLPSAGQSLLDLTHLPEGADDQVQANLVVTGEPPVATLPVRAAREVVFGDCSDELATWGAERLGEQPLAPFMAPVDAVEPAVPRAYVLCTRDLAIPPALQRRMIAENPCVDVVELDTDHSPMLSATRDLAAALDRFASGVVDAHMRRALLVLLAVLTFAAIAAPAHAAPPTRCSGAVVVGSDTAAMEATAIRVRGQSCGRGKAVLRAFLTLVRDEPSCLHDAQFGRGCEWRDHLCLRANIGVPRSNRCVADGTAVYWIERDGEVI